MTGTRRFEDQALLAAEREVTAALPELSGRRLELRPLELSRHGEGENYESELRLYAYRDDQLCDALEVHVWRDGGPAASLEELSEWFRSALRSLD
jgi:hypothetical protein